MRERALTWSLFAFLAVLIVFPLFVVFLLSVVPRWSTAFPSEFSLQWWVKLFEPMFLQSIYNTVIISVAATALTVAYAVLASYIFLYYEFKGKRLLFTLMLAPTYVAGTVLALGLLTAYPSIRNTFWIMLLAHFTIVSPLAFKTVHASMRKIPSSLVEASYSLGSNRLNTFQRVIVPLTRQGILSATVLGMGMNVSELSVSIMVYGADWITIPIRIYLERNWGILGIAGVLSTLLILFAIASTVSANRFGGNND